MAKKNGASEFVTARNEASNQSNVLSQVLPGSVTDLFDGQAPADAAFSLQRPETDDKKAKTEGSGSASGSAADFYATVPTRDLLYESGVEPIDDATWERLAAGGGLTAVGLERIGDEGSPFVVNKPADGQPSILINSSRVIINSKEGHTIIAGAKGVALTSREKVNIDADTSVTIFGNDGVYFGVPNKGVQPPAGGYPDPKTLAEHKKKLYKDGKKLKSYPAPDTPYEPTVLGLKLVNWLDDLLTVLKNNVILTPVGYAASREDSQWDFEALRTRLVEMLSTYIYVDGLSHQQPDFDSLQDPPTKVTKPQTSITINATVTGVMPTPPPAPGPITSPDANKPGYYNGVEGLFTPKPRTNY